MQPVASLQILNRVCVLWSKKLSLPCCSGCNSVFKCSTLVSLSLQQGTVLANKNALEFQLLKSISNIVKKIKRQKEAKLENASTDFMLYEEFICCSLIDTLKDLLYRRLSAISFGGNTLQK